MQYILEDNGNLTFMLEEAERDVLERLQEVQGDDHARLSHMLDDAGLSGNGVFMPISPADIGALTDAPMLSDAVVHEDDGTREVTGNVWWYPQYEIKSFLAELLTQGKVTFTAA